MKRFLLAFLCAALLLSCAVPALAADPDLVITTDTTISLSFVKYGNVTVKSGATLTIRHDSGFEITGALTVEPGAALISDGEGAGTFNFSMKGRACSITGIPLYYRSRDDGLVKEVPGGWAYIAAMDTWDWDGWCPAFKWNTQVQGWCLTVEMQDYMMGAPIFHSGRDMDIAERMALKLKGLGLFEGTGTNADGSPRFELDRRGKRVEALVMLIRLLGKKDEALSGTWSHPFTDVAPWADKYVGYAYETGLTKGISATLFGSDNDATMQMYLTFLLRALGQTDDGAWTEAFARAEPAGILSRENDPYELCESNFWRCDMVVASFRALEARCTDGRTLAETLIDEGVFTDGAYTDSRFW